MRLWLIKDDVGFHPYNDSDKEKADKIFMGESNLFEVVMVRNKKFHRKYFAMIKLAFDNQDDYKTISSFREAVQMEAGFAKPSPFICKTVEQKKKFVDWLNKQIENVKNDKPITFPRSKSIAYENMESEEFSELYEKVWKVIYDTYGHDRVEFEKELMSFL